MKPTKSNNPREVVTFSDWSAINQIPNREDPLLEAFSTTMLNKKHEIVGYLVTVFTHHSGVLCRVPIGVSPWSLSESQVVEMLNSYGFYCEYVKPPYQDQIKDSQIEFLKFLTSLNLSHIERTSEKTILALGRGTKTLQFGKDCLVDNYNFYDWMFLPVNRPVSIEKLLRGESIDSLDCFHYIGRVDVLPSSGCCQGDLVYHKGSYYSYTGDSWEVIG